jgi:hypothetical protein
MNKSQKQRILNDNWGKVKSDCFDFELIEKYFRKNHQTDCSQVISDKTIHDIDFHELFMLLDRTNSQVGQQFLYNNLRAIKSDQHFDKQEQLIDYYSQNEQSRIQAQMSLSRLDKKESYYIPALFQDEYIQKPSWFWIVPVLSLLSILSLLLTIFKPYFFSLLIVVLITNLLIHYWNKRNIYLYTSSIPPLLHLFKVSKDFLKIHPDAPVQESLKTLEAIKGGMSVFTIESKSNSDLSSIPWMILEYLKIFLLIEPIIVFRVLKKLDHKRSEMHDLFKYIGHIDSAISIASLRSSLKYYCKPSSSMASHPLKFEDIYHPLVEDCISNSLHVNGKSILLTGSNMSGKTTFIRTVAINVLCAQTINTCFANKFELKPMRIYSAIRITDSLMNDKSYYFEEVTTIKQMIDESQSGYYKLFLLDEIFKGTNTVERIAAGKAVLSYLGKGENLVFVSTHDIELTDLLADTYELYHFTEMVENEQIHFDYKLKKGNLATRNAIRILELNDYPVEIIAEAKEISKKITDIIK